MWLILLSIAAAIVLGSIYYIYTFWQRRGFPTEPPKIPFGCLDSVIKRQRSFGMAIYDVYQKSKDKVIGIYLIHRPALLVRDAEMARNVLVQDFSSFHDRGVYVDEENDPFSGNLFALKGERWKTLRTKLAPYFTSGKLKGMFGIIDDVGNKMLEYLENTVPENGPAIIEMKELFSRYAVDIIGSVIFGLEVDSFKDPKNNFRTITTKISEPTLGSVIRNTAGFLCPELEKLFVRIGWEEKATNSIKKLVRETVDFREKNNYVRRDLMQMLIQLRNTGKINTDDNMWADQSSADGFKSMSVECIAGQALLFLGAGFDTSASAAAFTIFELAKSPEILAKVRQDIDQATAKHDGKITYDSIQDMKYLDLCVMETIRKYPGLPILNRECTKDFQIPGSDLVIEKGTPIIISLFGIHRDPEYFPDPMKYDPERFLESNQNYNPVAYMPFGEGPRHCYLYTQRMGKINVKSAVAKLINRFDLEVIQKGEIEVDNFAVTIEPKGGVNIKLTKKKTIKAE